MAGGPWACPCRTGPHQPKVADAQLAVAVEQQVGGLEVTVHHPTGVQVLEAPQQLVDEELDVLLCTTANSRVVRDKWVGGWLCAGYV